MENPRYADSRYAVTTLLVAPLRILLTTDANKWLAACDI